MALLCCSSAFAQTSAATSTTASTTIEPTKTCEDLNLAEGESKCTSCSEVSTCSSGSVVTDKCDVEKACLQDGSTSLCLSVAKTECDICTAGQFTACDVFDPQVVNVCIPDKAPMFYENCESNEICQNGACVEDTTTPGGTDGTTNEACEAATGGENTIMIITYKPQCTSGLLCSGNEVLNIINCTEGYYYDPKELACKSLPIDNCKGLEDGLGPVRSDCTKFVVCQGGTQITELACGEEEKYDEQSKSCVSSTAESLTCPDLDGCLFESNSSGGSGTTTDSSTTEPQECTADNVNQRYPVEGDCKSYLTCRKTSGNSYLYVKGECPGTLVFNPETTYCDRPEVVTGCEK
ncbi:Chitin binding domain [Trinorchestia longiramus]|nr:Chitin binding domain [Trinorchestia longiramus]